LFESILTNVSESVIAAYHGQSDIVDCEFPLCGMLLISDTIRVISRYSHA
jgi:hypothetical protein